MKYKAIYKRDLKSEETLGVFDSRDDAVDTLIRFGDANISYCLDTIEDRRAAFEYRNFCMCGCGPSELLIEEIE